MIKVKEENFIKSKLKSKLKPLKALKTNNNILTMGNGKYGVVSNIMKPKFGDGKYYTFIPVLDNRNKYTHRCVEDGYYYHESWFEEELDFLKEEDFKIGEIM